MRQWYCAANGRQYGPMGEAVLREWIAQERVGPDDFVWCRGMADWAIARSVFPEAFAGPDLPRSPSLVQCPPPGGTGGLTPNGQITAQAAQILSGRWGLPIGVCLLLWLLSTAIGAIIPYIGSLVNLILGGPFTLGSVIFFLTFVRGGQAELGMMFHGFKRFGTALGAYLLVAIFVWLWMLLAMLPGIIVGIILGVVIGEASGSRSPAVMIAVVFGAIPGVIVGTIKQLSYAQTLYLIADRWDLGALQAITASKELMVGHKGNLFFLGLRYSGWALLCILTLGIGFLWLGPYMGTGLARFYDDLHAPAAGARAPAPTSPLPPSSPGPVEPLPPGSEEPGSGPQEC